MTEGRMSSWTVCRHPEKSRQHINKKGSRDRPVNSTILNRFPSLNKIELLAIPCLLKRGHGRDVTGTLVEIGVFLATNDSVRPLIGYFILGRWIKHTSNAYNRQRIDRGCQLKSLAAFSFQGSIALFNRGREVNTFSSLPQSGEIIFPERFFAWKINPGSMPCTMVGGRAYDDTDQGQKESLASWQVTT